MSTLTMPRKTLAKKPVEVTDHAIVRMMERVHGLSRLDLVKEVLGGCDPAKVRLPNGVYGCGTHKIRVVNGKVVTVITRPGERD